MVHLVRHSAGPGRPGKRAAFGVIFWFLSAGLIRGALSTVVDEGKAPPQNSTKRIFRDPAMFKKNGDGSFDKEPNAASLLQRTSRELPQIKNGNEFLLDNGSETDGISEAVKKLPLKSRSFLVIPFFRPGRSDSNGAEKKDFNTMIPTARFGRSLPGPAGSENGSPAPKRFDTVIPTMRFGRSGGKRQNGSSNSVIPYPRLGRSSPNVGESSGDDYFEVSAEESEGPDAGDVMLVTSEREKREDHDTIIPYPRTGRQESDDADLLDEEDKRSDNDYILPQMRYGRRSVILSSSPNTDETSEQNPHTFVLPYPRPGRSSKYPEKNGHSKNMQVILPYPRSQSDEENLAWDKRQNNYMLPFARLGRSAVKIPSESRQSSDFNDLVTSHSKSGQKNAPEKLKDTDLSSVFMIPYPRPGKKSLLALAGSQGKQRQNNSGKESSDYVLPYPRPGKKSSVPPSSKNFKNGDSENENARQFMVPYPRPGRSEANGFDSNAEGKRDNEAYDSFLVNSENNIFNGDALSKSADAEVYPWRINKSSKNTFMVPYARLLGIRDRIVVPARYTDDETDLDYGASDYESLTNNEDFADLHDDGTSHLRYKRSNSVVPYPRLGRSDMVIPYPRLGRSDTVVPYPRPGRSNFVIPHPRLGRSNSVVPYPRPGRSNSVIPYPRIGRSNSVLPYPRLGRSNSVIPYPRLGRSNSVVPYPRPGRSHSVIPYPRPGRSDSVVPYPRPGRSDSVVPYPRPGRSDTVVPYPRLGRSDSVIPYPRPGRSNSVVPYPRPGRSDFVVPTLRLRRASSYPRSDRSNSVVPYPRLGRARSVLHRSRRSLTVVPYPRPGRSSKEPNTVPKYGNWILPNIRPGRSNSYGEETDDMSYLNSGSSQSELFEREDPSNHIIANRRSTDLIVPYPRLSQSGYIVPNPRFGRSPNSVKYDEAMVIDTVIPYPRVGRSQEQVTPSPELHSSPHKLNKHMLTKADDSIYLLPYPRPGRYSE